MSTVLPDKAALADMGKRQWHTLADFLVSRASQSVTAYGDGMLPATGLPAHADTVWAVV